MKINAAVFVLAVSITASTSLAAAPTRISGSFGGTVYGSKPVQEYSWGGEWSIPGNYAVSFSAQSEVLPFEFFAFGSLDRFWSGSEDSFTNSAFVLSGGIGRSFALGYSRFELFAGVSRYDETFEVRPFLDETSEVNIETTGGLVGANLVFPVFDQVKAIVAYRLVLRGEKLHDGEFDTGGAFSIKTNTLDFVISFGVGFAFGA